MLINILVKFLVYSLEWMLVCIYQLLFIVLYYSAHFLSKLIFYLCTHIILDTIRLFIFFLIWVRSRSDEMFLNFIIVNCWISLFLWALLSMIFAITHVKLFIGRIGKTIITNLIIEISVGSNKPFEHKIIKCGSIDSFILWI